MATLPGIWCQSISAGNDQSSVPDLVKHHVLTCTFFLTEAAPTIFLAALSLWCTSMLLGYSATNKQQQHFSLLLLLLLHSQLDLWGSPVSVRFFCVHIWPFFKSNLRGSHILSSWMVHAGCGFVAIHPSRTRMSGSFESVRWNACVHRPDLGLHSHLKEFWGNGVRTHVNSTRVSEEG